MRGTHLRQEIDKLVAAGDSAAALRLLAELWRREPTSATAAFTVSRYESLRAATSFTPHRVALLRSFTLEPVIPLLRATAFSWGIDLSVHLGDFNAYPQEILDPSSTLYSSAPDTAIMAAQTRDLAPELWNGDSGVAPSATVERVLNSFQSWIAAFRNHSSANLIVHSLEPAPAAPSAAIEEINHGLHQICAAYHGVYVLDYGALIARHGYANWHDEIKWTTVRMPIRAGHLIHLAEEWLRFLVPLSGRSAKVLVVDLDNTLWGGVIGEDGLQGIQLASDGPGAAFQAVQRALLDLHDKGMLLAISSKNNFEDAMEAIERHPGMILKSEHFAATRINWGDKSQSLREIAAELNLGIDSFAFLDDNPAERSQLRAALPEVTVIELFTDPTTYAATIRDSPVLQRLTLSAEDQQRTALYAAERQRSSAAQTFQSKEDFFRSLDQTAEIAPLTPATLPRVAQLTQKTNQFNLTTRRYTEQQIAEIAARPGWQVNSLRVHDRFGDHGLVGVAVTADQGDCCEIDTLLLSCRVIGRTIETAFLAYLAASARSRAMKVLRGWFLPTRKNSPAKNFYAQHGFRQESSNGGGALWSLDLEKSEITVPDWIRIHIPTGASR